MPATGLLCHADCKVASGSGQMGMKEIRRKNNTMRVCRVSRWLYFPVLSSGDHLRCLNDLKRGKNELKALFVLLLYRMGCCAIKDGIEQVFKKRLTKAP